MFDSIAGLPLHPLVLHAFVVLGPLTALLAIAYALVPKLRKQWTWVLFAGAVVTAVTAFVTKESGEALLERLGETSPILDLHQWYGDLAGIWGVVFGLVTATAVLVVWRRARPQRWLSVVAAALVIGTAGTMLVFALLAGHAGATSVWG